MSQLKDKVALITGGGSGIGLAAARLFLKKGAKVAIAGRNQTKLEAARDELQAGDRLLIHPTDVAQLDQVRQLVQHVIEKFGRIDILVNSAGVNTKERAFRQLTPDQWELLINANLNGAYYCMHEVLPGMLERKDGIIVNINSIAGKRASMLGGVAYSASKFGMSSLGLCLGAEEKDNGIRVCNIYPGEVDTPILENRPNPVTEEHRQRILRASDVAETIAFVASQPPHVSIPELVIKPTTQLYV